MAAAPKPGPASAPGSQPPPAPTGTPEAMIVANPNEPTPAPAAPPEAAREAAEAEVHGATRAQLGALQRVAAKELDDFKARVMEGGSDFTGSDAAEAIEQNPAYKEIAMELRIMFQNAELERIPTQFTEAWMNAVTTFMLAEIRSYGASWKFWQTWGAMNLDAAKEAVKKVKDANSVGRSGLHGVGKFEDWIATSPFAQKFDAWQSGKEQEEEEAAQDLQAEEQQKKQAEDASAALAPKKSEVEIHANQLLTLLGSVSVTVKPTQLQGTIEGLRAKISQAPDDAALDQIDKDLTGLEDRITQLEKLEEVADTVTGPEREDILKKVRDGGDVAEAKAKLKKLKETKRQSVAAAARGETPMIDSWMDQLEEFDPGDDEAWYGKIFKMGKQFLAAVLGIATTLVAKNAWARRWVVGEWGLVSNERLSALGDTRAALAMKAEHEFAQFGIPTKHANILGERKTRDVVALIRTPARLNKLVPDTASDAALNARFQQLASQLEAKNGATSDAKLFSFMGENKEWASIQYEAAGTSTASAPAAAPAQQQAAPETPEAKIGKMFEGLTVDEQRDLRGAKVKDVLAGTFPATISQGSEKAKKIAAKIAANGGEAAWKSQETLTVDQFLKDPTNASKDWALA